MADPISPQYRQRMQDLARWIDNGLNVDGQKTLAFVLLVAEFGKAEGGRVNYVSNAERADVLAMMREYIARAEGRYVEGKGPAGD